MSTQAKKYLGITAPINLNPPSDLDLELTASLLQALEELGYTESQEESKKREAVLGRLHLMVKDFVREVGIAQGLPDFVVAEAGGKIFTFGSYRLGVHRSGADIDTLCVVPQHVSRADFFSTFASHLQQAPEVTEVTAVPDAYVPVIKMKFSDIPIDLVFASLKMPTIPEDLNLLDHSHLRNLDEKCILSLNGSRTTDEILKLVPNVATFHTALKCIKVWAQRRGLYSNSFGYLAGVASAMLVARICQLYPNASASTIVSRFFRIYCQWNWPQPVLLKPIEEVSFLAQMKVWNPKIYPPDRLHRMPVITPAFPSMCSTHNVSISTQAVITAEFKRGMEVINEIEERKASWSKLFAKSEFFYTYKNYIQIIGLSRTHEQHKIWSGYLESRIRHFTTKLEYVTHIAGAPPFPEMFECSGMERQAVLAKHFHQQQQEEIVQAAEEPQVFSACFYVALSIGPKQTPGPIKLDIHSQVTDFREFVTKWDGFVEGMDLVIRDIKRDDLPDYLFEGAERPPKLAKRAPKKPEELQPVAAVDSLPPVASPLSPHSHSICSTKRVKEETSPTGKEGLSSPRHTSGNHLDAK